ncbi:MAG: agmatine deiminase family protein [Sphingobacteriales bacterium]|nr:agmatine deiminase family protein [Sphingobacteriales bacterium]
MRGFRSITTLFIFLTLHSFAQEDHRLSPSERQLIPQYMNSRTGQSSAVVTPPASPVRTMAEWEELQALLVAWKSYPSILREIVRAAKTETRVLIAYSGTDTEASITAYLAAGGVDTVNVDFLGTPVNSVWSRDYGPWSVYTNDVDSLLTIDWIYNRPRPADDAVPVAVANLIATPLYQTTTAPWNLVHTGGNFMTDGLGTGFSSELILEENSPAGGFGINHTEPEIDSIMQAFMGIDRYIKMDKLQYDVIHHIDMHMKLLDEQTLLVGQYPQGISDGPQIEANLLYVVNTFNSAFGTPYRVVRIPMPDDNNLYPSNGGDYFTYTNSSFINKTLIVPVYGIPEDSIGLQVYRNELPGYRIVPINCAGMIGALGALHCITKDIGTSDPLLISHQPLPNTSDTVNSYTVSARIQHRSGITQADLYWRTDTLLPWQSAMMNPVGPTYFWNGSIPAQPAGTTIYYYIAASSSSGKNQVRPLPAPAGYWKFDVTGTTGLAESAQDRMDAVFPNPCRAITCVPVSLSKPCFASVDLVDAQGKYVIRVHEGALASGEHKLFFDASNLPAGVYTLQLNASGIRSRQRVAVIH